MCFLVVSLNGFSWFSRVPLHYFGFGYAALVATGGIIGYARAGRASGCLLQGRGLLGAAPVSHEGPWGPDLGSRPPWHAPRAPTFGLSGRAEPAFLRRRLLLLPYLQVGGVADGHYHDCHKSALKRVFSGLFKWEKTSPAHQLHVELRGGCARGRLLACNPASVGSAKRILQFSL